MSKYTEDLIDKAQSYWSQGKEIPLDLFTDMAMAGLDVVSLENKLKNITKRGKQNGKTTI